MKKFRIWSNNEQNWILDPTRVRLNSNFTLELISDNPTKCTIQQFTGLFDINGKEIYEGDILKEHHYEDWTDDAGFEYIGIVEYIQVYDITFNTLFSGFVTFPKSVPSSQYTGFGNKINKDCEIIGNIFGKKFDK
jgi:uncharacterized phage protein (TIGR01671 family)